jgi:hypothetical protein
VFTHHLHLLLFSVQRYQHVLHFDLYTSHEQVERVQRASFIHFLVLCFVPTALLIIVVTTIVSKETDCGTVGLTTCKMEPRSFTNAFTSVCVCDAVRLATSATEEADEDNPFWLSRTLQQ